MGLERLSVLRTESVAKGLLRRKMLMRRPLGFEIPGSTLGARQVYWCLVKGMLVMGTLVVGLTWVPSLAAQSCVYCAVNGGCYPTSRGYFYCWPTGNGCQVSVPCAVAGGGCHGDPECLPRPVPLFLEDKKSLPTAGVKAKGKAKEMNSTRKTGW